MGKLFLSLLFFLLIFTSCSRGGSEQDGYGDATEEISEETIDKEDEPAGLEITEEEPEEEDELEDPEVISANEVRNEPETSDDPIFRHLTAFNRIYDDLEDLEALLFGEPVEMVIVVPETDRIQIILPVADVRFVQGEGDSVIIRYGALLENHLVYIMEDGEFTLFF
jgi:hypothetical protein